MIKITGEELPNIPWQEKPEGCHDVVWRYSGNPIIERDAIPSSNSIFNSAVVPFEGKFAGVFRCDSRSRSMDIFADSVRMVFTGISRRHRSYLKVRMRRF